MSRFGREPGPGDRVTDIPPSCSIPTRTRIQRATALKGETAWTRFSTVTAQMFREEGPAAFYKGITPRVARVAPGQAVVFTVYERIKRFVSSPSLPLHAGKESDLR